MRTVIVGNAGSGKTTLARSIAAAGRVPVLDLDTICWEPQAAAVPRPAPDVQADLQRWCEAHEGWVIEGCYGRLAQAVLVYRPRLIFLDPGCAVCQENCRRRDWEPHKYASRQEQDARLDTLLAWVAAYYERDDDMSLAGHQALYDAYDGPRQRLTRLPALRG